MDKLQILLATGNANKTREFREMLDAKRYEVRSLTEAGIEVDIVEDGTTFEENGRIKARSVAEILPEALKHKVIVVADDSGLVVDALGGEPGIYSARYLGEDTPYEQKNREILRRLEGVQKEQRSARFVCAMAAVLPDGQEFAVVGKMEGYIGEAPAGENGFGYDPIFYVDQYHTSTAAITPDQKNEISHRGKALRAIKERLDNYAAHSIS